MSHDEADNHSPASPMSSSPAPHTPPLKRHAALQPLSREHMGALIRARDLQRAADADSADRTRAIAAFLDSWRTEIRDHFDDEERLLLPLEGSPHLRSLGQRLVREHRAIRDLAARCEREAMAVAAEADTVRRLGTLLHDHVRWEEREYFETVQHEHPGALEAMEHEAAGIERRRPHSRVRTTLAWHERNTEDKGASPMSDDRLRTPPVERFAADHLDFDLHAEAAALEAEQAPTRHGHRQKTLYKCPGRTVALFVLNPGAALPEHAAAGAVTVQAIEGEVEVRVVGSGGGGGGGGGGVELHRLSPGRLLAMAPGVRHDVRASGRAVFLLQVSLAPVHGGA